MRGVSTGLSTEKGGVVGGRSKDPLSMSFGGDSDKEESFGVLRGWRNGIGRAADSDDTEDVDPSETIS